MRSQVVGDAYSIVYLKKRILIFVNSKQEMNSIMLVLVLIDCEINFFIFGSVEQTKAAAYEESFKKGFLMGGMYLKVQSIFLKQP
jgi:hypothetical protein